MISKVEAISKILIIYNSEKYSTDEEKIAVISALGEIGTSDAYNSLLHIYEQSNKSSSIKIATIMAIAKCSD